MSHNTKTLPDGIDRYEIKSEIGRGGMATVYHAHDPKFNRDVALKVLPRELMHDPQFFDRFMLEARTIAALEHSSIVPIYDYGEDDGQMFLVLRLMNGGSLKERIGEEGMSLDEAVPIVERIAAALDAAHKQGIVHRDVKPTNVLFDSHNDAHLADFGLVKLMEASHELTGSGLVGTPAYLAPEMTQRMPITPLADVYALGAMIFQLATGELPYKGDSPVATMVAHITEPLPDPSMIVPSLPPNVAQVIARAMAKKPEGRYQSASALARDFKAAVDGQEIDFPVNVEKSDTLVLERDKIRKRSQPSRLPLIAGVVGGLLLLIVLGVVLSGNGRFVFPADRQPDAAIFMPEQPSDGGSKADDPTPIPDIPGGGGEYILTHSNRGGEDELWIISLVTLEQVALTDNEAISDSNGVWSPDGSQIAFVSNRNGNPDIFLMDPDGGNVRPVVESPANDIAPAWSPDGTQLVFASDRGFDYDIYISDLSGGEPRLMTDNDVNDFAPDWSPDGQSIVYYSFSQGNADIWLVSVNATLRARLTEDLSDDFRPVWSPDGSRIAFTSPRDGDWEVFIMDADGSNLFNLTDNQVYDSAPAWSPDGEWIVFSSGTLGELALYMIRTDGTDLQQLSVPASYYFDYPDWQPGSN